MFLYINDPKKLSEWLLTTKNYNSLVIKKSYIVHL